MASLPDTLRRRLEKTVVEAREVAEAGARAAVERLAVGRSEPFAEMATAERELRVKLRAHARQLGDPRMANGEQGIRRLVVECAYDHWHRMLFARFLAENRLLIHPEHGVPVTLAECEELAAETGEKDGWCLAGRFAARMLPAIFRPDDSVLSVRFAPEQQQALEALLAGLTAEIFTADDSLGWVYQFWQAKRKDEVNKSGNKIGADELPAVTQLFTEPYMVQFLLHNTLGAWWAGRVLAARPELAQTAASEEELRRACALPGSEWTYLRFMRAKEGELWRPGAETFVGWPEHAADITVLDPCCGSGHFLVEAFRILVSMRMVEGGLSAREACDTVLRDNLFGLEIDERCTQIAAFNLALAAWSYPGAGGYRLLPDLHIACSGLAVGAREEEWLKLGGTDDRLREGMRRLYRLFKDAATLGSLIDARRAFEAKPGELEFDKGTFNALRPLLEDVLAREEVKRDAQATEAGIAAQGMAKAAAVLAGSYTLVTTNVPYVGRGKQDDTLRGYCARMHPDSKADLATCFVERCLEFCAAGGSIGLVTPQTWLFLGAFTNLRRKLLNGSAWNLVSRLGPAAFQDMNWWRATTLLVSIAKLEPVSESYYASVDASETRDPLEKGAMLLKNAVTRVRQAAQLQNPDARVIVREHDDLPLLAEFCDSYKGLSTGDLSQYIHFFWERPTITEGWVAYQGGCDVTAGFGGRSQVLRWENGNGALVESPSCFVKGRQAWGRIGVSVNQMNLAATFFTGEMFDENAAAIVPKDPSLLPAVWTFVESADFREAIRAIDAGSKVTNKSLIKVPFDLALWQQIATDNWPSGLPEPQSNDPTQWLFHGHAAGMLAAGAESSPAGIADLEGSDRHPSLISRTPNFEGVLQVAVARLLDYRWPAEADPHMRVDAACLAWSRRCDELLTFVSADGIVCIPSVRGEQPAADRLRRLLAGSFGAAWTPTMLSALLDQAGLVGQTLEDWLRDEFFEKHCQLFYQRPFVWHIWDGRRRDGFAALVNYHKLDRKLLERLAYTVLGDWIALQRQGCETGERGADDRLAAAEALQQKLALILEGEPPYDVFVRWKAIHDQPIGWEPDLNDGVRMNIRPFVEAGVLRKNPKIQWTKDRGSELESVRPRKQFPWFWRGGEFTGERVNDFHLTGAEKRAARERAARERGTAR